MNTKIIKIKQENIEDLLIEEAAKVLKNGGLVALPTETVYGLGADALNVEAAAKIYAAKGRPSDNPLIVHIADEKKLEDLVSHVPDKARQVMKAFWPGPLTIIFKKKDKVPYGTTGGLDTVAIRMPSHPVAKRLIEVSGVSIAAPSANTSGHPSPTTADHVIHDLSGKIDLIIDSGLVGIGIESTILDVTEDIPVILRPGSITKEMLEEVIGIVNIDPAIMGNGLDENTAPKAPGMKYKHYAPKGDLSLVTGKTIADVVEVINKLAIEQLNKGFQVGIISTDETKNLYPYGIVRSIGSRQDEMSVARGLYGILRDFDEDEVDVIYSESFDQDNLGQAIMNRLLKAAGHHMIHC